MRTLIELLRRILFAVRRHSEVAKVATLNCCDQPEILRKSPARRHLDLMYSVVRWNELSTLYFAQQMDLKGRSIERDYLSYTRFRKLRDARNGVARRSGGYNYACLLRDKLLFERYFSAGGVPVAKSLGEVLPDQTAVFPGHHEADLCTIGSRYFPFCELFVKPRFGIKGKGVFKIRFVSDGVEVNGAVSSPEEVSKRIAVPCLVQRVIEQHPVIAQLHPSSLNTLRIITYRCGECIEVFLVYIRMAGGGEIADNNMTSRAIVRVDEETGQLFEQGYAIRGQIARVASRHPDTAVSFSDVVIPHMRECVKVARTAHAWMPGMHSLGWDVAITPDGPVLIEGNEDWGATTAMWAWPDFVPRFHEMIARQGIE